MDLPPIRFARTSDGVNIAYVALGAGPPIVFASNIFGDIAFYKLKWEHVRGITDGLVARNWSVVRYDVRGMGSSSRAAEDISLDARVRDLEAVIDSLDLDRFVLGGVDFGAATAIAYAAQHPQRAAKLLLLNPWVRGSDRFAVPAARVANAIQPSAEPDWPFATKAISSIATDFEGRENAKAVELAKAIRDATSPVALANHRRASMAIDVEAYLGRLTMPTLVTHDPYFAFGSFDLCQEVAAGIRSAGLVTIDENSLAGDFHDCHVDAIHRFLLREGSHITRGASAVKAMQPPEASFDALTSRETEVLERLAAGLSNKEIAAHLGIAVPTVERHLVNVYAKIGARGRADATAYALRHKL